MSNILGKCATIYTLRLIIPQMTQINQRLIRNLKTDHPVPIVSNRRNGRAFRCWLILTSATPDTWKCTSLFPFFFFCFCFCWAYFKVSPFPYSELRTAAPVAGRSDSVVISVDPRVQVASVVGCFFLANISSCWWQYFN